MNRTGLLLASLFVFTPIVAAEGSEHGGLVIDAGTASEISAACREARDIADSVFFEESAKLAAETVVTYCSGRSRADFDLYDNIIAVLRELEQEASDHGVEWEVDVDEGRGGIDRLVDYVEEDSIKGTQIPNIDYTIASIDGPVKLTSGNLTARPSDQDQCDDAVKALAQGQDCNTYLEEFSDIYKAVHSLYASADAARAATRLTELDQQWTNFMEETVDQTPLELWWNGLRFRNKHKGYRGFVAPPSWQHILLKPYVAVDWLGDAPDGSEVQEAVVLDVWGIKRWNAREVEWYQPIGGSIHIAASDRAGYEDWGIGFSIHFTEMHTIGVTSYDGEVGVFLSFDLWKNATDKYQTAEQRIDNFRTLKDEIEDDPVED